MTDLGPRSGAFPERRAPRAEAPDPRAAAAAARAAHARATRRGLRVLGVLAALGSLQLLFMIGVELDRTIRHRASITALEAELATLADEERGLRAIVAHAGDPAYREALARRQGFLRADEARVVVLPPAP